MKIHLALFALFAAACTGDLGTKDTGTTESGTTECANFYDGPISIDVATVTCDGHEVTYYAETTGWTDGGYVFTQETGNTEPQYSDEHDLESFDYDACGEWDHLRRRLQDRDTMSDPINDWQRNVSTVFDCDDHFGDPNVITYAFAVVDLDGNEAACIVYGDDPEGMINGDYQRVDAQPSFDLNQCVRGVNTM